MQILIGTKKNLNYEENNLVKKKLAKVQEVLEANENYAMVISEKKI
jgi:hypothetical protein